MDMEARKRSDDAEELRQSKLISPYGGELVNLMAPAGELAELKKYARRLPSVQLTERAVCDLELLATGAFSPLSRFIGQDDYQRILDELQLVDGHVFPIPIILPVTPGDGIRIGRDTALRDSKNELLAVMP